jgi:hypothetical protein
MKRTLGVTFASLILFAAAAKPDTFPVAFAGGNPGDGGTITTNGCAVCNESDVTFDFTLLGIEFSSPSSPLNFSGTGSLFGHDSAEFQQTAAQYPLVYLFGDGSWHLFAGDAFDETAPQGTYSVDPPSASTPEPSSFLLCGTMLLTLGFAARRRLRTVQAR